MVETIGGCGWFTAAILYCCCTIPLLYPTTAILYNCYTLPLLYSTAVVLYRCYTLLLLYSSFWIYMIDFFGIFYIWFRITCVTEA